MQYGKIAKMALASASVLGLSSCLSAPGAFTSDLVLLRDGSYSFSYDGEVQLMTLAMMMSGVGDEDARTFEPYCEDEIETEDGGYDWQTRDCTTEEIAEQRQQFDAQVAETEAEQAQMRAAMGGIDPTDPATIDEFAERLERQAGWQSVEHVGNALFKVRYRTSGQIPDNFGFPLISDAPAGQPFVTVARWKDGKVRVDAPMFVSRKSGDAGMLATAFTSGFMGKASEEGMDLPEANGTFTIRTDGEVLTNNTETGPSPEARLQVLRWDVGMPNRGAPQALIGF